jgi:uncharacterized membrane protein YfcA
MIGVALFLIWRPGKKTAGGTLKRSMENVKNSAWSITILLVGTGLSTSLGFISSFFGIGGGFLYVPALVYF